jgi:hypothetical protein
MKFVVSWCFYSKNRVLICFPSHVTDELGSIIKSIMPSIDSTQQPAVTHNDQPSIEHERPPIIDHDEDEV